MSDNVKNKKLLERYKNNDKFSKDVLGINVESVTETSAKVSLKLDEKMMNPLGITHGGVVFSVIDVASGLAMAASGKSSVTLTTTINYTAPSIEGQVIYAEAKRVNETYRTSQYYVQATNEEGKLLATAQVIMFLKSFDK